MARLRTLLHRADRLAIRRTARGRRLLNLPLLDWTRRYLPHVLSCAPSVFHQWLCERLDVVRHERGSRLNVLAPRGAAKSSYVSLAYPLRELLEGRERFVALLSDTSAQAKAFLGQIKREIETNETIRRDYGNLRGSVWREGHVQLASGCEVLALGTGGKIRGRKSVGNRRPTLIVCDDVENKDHMVSALRRERSWGWLTKDVIPAGEPGTNVVVVGTSLHRECAVCRLEHTPGWASRKFKAVEAWPERMDLWADWEQLLHDHDDPDREAKAQAFYAARKAEMDRGAQVLWPEREPLYDLMVLRATIGATAFASEKQNNPVDPSQCEWPAELFEHPQFWFQDWPSGGWTVKTIGVDPSKGKNDRAGDYSAIVLYGRHVSEVEYVEASLARRTVEQMCADLVEVAKVFQPDGIAVETNQFQELLLIPLQSAARDSGVELATYKVVNTVNKLVRIRQLGTPLTERRFRFMRRSPGTQLLVDQMRDFPHSDHDDGPDALHLARRLAVELSSPGKMKPRR